MNFVLLHTNMPTVRDKFDQLHVVDKFAVEVDDNKKKTLAKKFNFFSVY